MLPWKADRPIVLARPEAEIGLRLVSAARGRQGLEVRQLILHRRFEVLEPEPGKPLHLAAIDVHPTEQIAGDGNRLLLLEQKIRHATGRVALAGIEEEPGQRCQMGLFIERREWRERWRHGAGGFRGYSNRHPGVELPAKLAELVVEPMRRLLWQMASDAALLMVELLALEDLRQVGLLRAEVKGLAERHQIVREVVCDAGAHLGREPAEHRRHGRSWVGGLWVFEKLSHPLRRDARADPREVGRGRCRQPFLQVFGRCVTDRAAVMPEHQLALHGREVFGLGLGFAKRVARGALGVDRIGPVAIALRFRGALPRRRRTSASRPAPSVC